MSGTGDFTGKQLSQPAAGALGHLAVLLPRPTVPATELAALHVARELTRKHEPLVVGELRRELADATQVVAQHRKPLDVGPSVGDLNAAAFAIDEWKRVRERRLDRATPAERAAPVVHAREQALLERIGNVGVARERYATLGARQQLERRLAVAVLEILVRETPAMRRQQQLAARASDERDRFDARERAEPPAPQKPCSALLSGRHVSMSVQVARRPPSQLVRVWLRAFDRFQQRSPRLGFVVAMIGRYSDQQGSQMGALIAYYGFFSLFPLLLVFVTVLGFVLEGDHATQESVLHSTLSQFPIIGNQLQSNVHTLKGSVPALVIGLIGATWAGLGITGAAQSAFNKVWEIPRAHQLGFLAWRVRGLGLLVVFGVLSIVSTVIAGYVTAQTTGVGTLLGGIVVALAANLLLFFTAFRMLTSEEVDTRDLIPGVIVAAVLWQLLQHIGGFYVEHVVRHAKETSGLFAFVLGLLTWLYLGGQVAVLAAETNVVRARRLWPRALFPENK
jgi:membrane protein